MWGEEGEVWVCNERWGEGTLCCAVLHGPTVDVAKASLSLSEYRNVVSTPGKLDPREVR